MKKLLAFLKTLQTEIKRIKIISNNMEFSEVDFACQDESRLG